MRVAAREMARERLRNCALASSAIHVNATTTTAKKAMRT
jgi:hypothetical protein